MKKALFMFLTCLFLFPTAHAAELSQPHITVYGEAEEEVAPDRIVWYLNVTNKAPGLSEAAEAHARIVGEILALLKKSDIPGDDIQTSRMQFGENWNYRNSSRVKEGYYAATDIRFKLAQMDRYDELWMKFSEYDSLSVNSVTYEISDDAKYRQDLQRRALLAAREKAQRMTRVLDTEIGEPLVIEEEAPATGLSYNSTRMYTAQIKTEAGSQSAIAPGSITLSTRVTVIYRLINSTQ